jgi:S-(hydroxymethyl)glutathione dehydrogenase/alcohol dehydrogenase
MKCNAAILHGVGQDWSVDEIEVAGAKRVVAVDPVEFEREQAMELGATHTFESMEEALPAVTEMTAGQMADKVIMTPGVMDGDLMALGTQLAGKGGTIVVTAVAPITQTESSVNLFELAMRNKEIKDAISGPLNPRHDTLKLDEQITSTYSLADVSVGEQAMRDGENILGVIVHGS